MDHPQQTKNQDSAAPQLQIALAQRKLSIAPATDRATDLSARSGCSGLAALRALEAERKAAGEAAALGGAAPSAARAILESEAVGSYLMLASRTGNVVLRDIVVDAIADMLGRIYGYFNIAIPSIGVTNNKMLYLKDLALGFIVDFAEMTLPDWALFYDKLKKRTIDIPRDPNGHSGGQFGTGTVVMHTGTVFNNLSPAQLAEWLHVYRSWRVAERERLLAEQQARVAVALQSLAADEQLAEFLRNMITRDGGEAKSILVFAPDFQRQCLDFIAIGGTVAARLLWRHAENQGRGDIQLFLEAQHRNT